MSRKIVPGKQLVKPFNSSTPELPIHLPVIQYIRQSTDAQVKANEDSTYMQDEEFSARLYSVGFTDIIKIDADQGISAQKLLHQRGGLNDAYSLVRQGKAGAIAAFDASRLWRDTTHTHYNSFISDVVMRYKIPVLFANQDDYEEPIRVFWPHRTQDMDALREEFKQAAFELRRIDKLNQAKKRAIQNRISYGGGAVPVGFLVETEILPSVPGKKAKRRNYYVIYEPHAKLVRWLFRRFRALDGNLSRLGRECLATGFSFPKFEDVDKLPHIALKFDGNRYPVHNRGGLLSILTNPAYIGWYVFDGVVVSKTAHEAIAPMDDFLFAYKRLSLTTLDGELNEDRPVINRRYGEGCEALLEGIVESDGKPVYVMAHNQTYTARTFNDGWKTTELVVGVKQLDTAFMGALRYLLALLEGMHALGIAVDLREKIETLLNEKAEEASTLEEDIANIDKGIREWEMAKRVAMHEEYEAGVIEATRQLKKLTADKEAIKAKAQHVDTEREDLAELHSLLDRVMHAWDGMPFDLKRRFIKMTVEKANIREETPHIIRIDVELKEPIKRTLIGYMFRHRGGKSKWEDEEMAVLKHMYKQADRLDILKALPTRTWDSIMQQSMTMGLDRTTRLNTSGIHEALTYADAELMKQVGMDDTKRSIWKQEPEIEDTINQMLMLIDQYESGGIDAVLQENNLDFLPASVEEFCTARKVRRWG